MSYQQEDPQTTGNGPAPDEQVSSDPAGSDPAGNGRYRDEVYSRRVEAGKRTYFFDVKSTRSGDDYFVTVTERKRLESGGQEKYRIFLYKEDFGKFVRAMHDVIHHIKEERLPEHDFERLPELTGLPEDGDGQAAA